MRAAIRLLAVAASALLAATASAQAPREMGWRALGAADINRGSRDRRVIEVRGAPRIAALRLCCENFASRLHGVRVRFTNHQSQELLHLPGSVQRGSCTPALNLSGPRGNVRSVEVTATSLGTGRSRIRLEGR